MDEREFWSAKEAAWFLGISPVELDRLREEGKLSGAKKSWRGWNYTKEDIEAWADSLPKPEPVVPPKGLALVRSLFAELPPLGDEKWDSEVYTDQALIIKIINTIVTTVIESGETELVFESTYNSTRIRAGLPGNLWLLGDFPRHLHRPLTNRLLVLSEVDMANLVHPQVGILRIRYKDAPIHCRVSWTPSQHGGKVHIRFHYRQQASLDSKEWLWPKHKQLIERLEKKQGMVLFVGPPGSGKTTVASGILKNLETSLQVIHTLEWPVELNLTTATQTERNPRNGLTPLEAARTAVRSNADIFFLNVIEDAETAEAVFFAAEAGLGVAATMSIARPERVSQALSRAGIDVERQQEFVKAIVVSRRLPCVCPYCRLSLLPSAELREEMSALLEEDAPEHIYTRSETGCPECQYSGLKSSLTTLDWWNLDGTRHSSVRKGLLWAVARGWVGVEELT